MPTTHTAFYGIAFETPPKNRKGETVRVDDASMKLLSEFNVGILGYGDFSGMDDCVAIFRIGTHRDIRPDNPPTQRLETNPEWRAELLSFCRFLGITDPPEPCWTLVWQKD